MSLLEDALRRHNEAMKRQAPAAAPAAAEPPPSVVPPVAQPAETGKTQTQSLARAG